MSSFTSGATTQTIKKRGNIMANYKYINGYRTGLLEEIRALQSAKNEEERRIRFNKNYEARNKAENIILNVVLDFLDVWHKEINSKNIIDELKKYNLYDFNTDMLLQNEILDLLNQIGI